jgi:hypothetical protein
MKLQYLGDSRDSFKWDYHDYLTASLDYPILNVAFMMTPDDNTNHGATNPRNFSARENIIAFCDKLKTEKDRLNLSDQFKQGHFKEVSSDLTHLMQQLPKKMKSNYSVVLHRGSERFKNQNRREYFSDITRENKQVYFLDPDNGFQPEKKYSAKHVLYSDIESILQQISEQAVISVFQYFRRISFVTDFARIRQRLIRGHATAIYWHSLMFVAISKSEETIDKVRSVNQEYSQVQPVNIIQ